VINLDPANDILPYKADIDISDLITISDVMDTLKLGPNGGLVYCMEYLEKNIDWLKVFTFFHHITLYWFKVSTIH
jgi:hypothetical protein